MDRATLPILLVASPALRKAVGKDLSRVATEALRAMLRHRKGVEVAHQQIDWRRLPIAFSSRIGRLGDIVLELDVGNPHLADRNFLEQDLRRAEAEARGRPKRR
jgi:hypothetical protein